MKILCQVDDYGITRGVAAGICDAAKYGIVRATGIFMNMPWAEDVVKDILNIEGVSVGVDINVLCGPCAADPKLIPTLIDSEGNFVPSKVRLQDPEWGIKDFYPIEEIVAEGCAQVEKFIKVTGQKPAYVQNHSVKSPNYRKAIPIIAEKCGIPYMDDIKSNYNMVELRCKRHVVGDEYTYDNQNRDMVAELLEELEEAKEKGLEYVCVCSHGGYLDTDLFKYSRFTWNRFRDIEMTMSPKVKEWIKKNGAELVNIDDLPIHK